MTSTTIHPTPHPVAGQQNMFNAVRSEWIRIWRPTFRYGAIGTLAVFAATISYFIYSSLLDPGSAETRRPGATTTADLEQPGGMIHALGPISTITGVILLSLWALAAASDYDTDQSAAAADLARVRRAWDTNLFGTWQVTQRALPIMHRADGARAIVNVSSSSGQLETMGAGPPGYAIAKAGLNALTRILAAECAPHGILVNAVCPGWVRTDMGGANATRSVEAGAASVTWAATLSADGPTGGFFRDGEPLAW